jgi:hypothetical protein
VVEPTEPVVYAALQRLLELHNVNLSAVLVVRKHVAHDCSGYWFIAEHAWKAEVARVLSEFLGRPFHPEQGVWLLSSSDVQRIVRKIGGPASKPAG